MTTAVDWPVNRDRHHRVRHFVEALPDAPEAKLTERGGIALGDGPVAEQAEQERGMSPIQELQRARRIDRVHLVAAQLRLERVERAVHLAAGPAAEADPVGDNASLA